MRTSLSLVATATALVVGGCTAASEDGARHPTAPGFKQLHAALFATTCAASGCHSGARGTANLSFANARAAFDRLVSVTPTQGAAAADGFLRVAPGEPDRSLLLWKLSASPADVKAHAYGAAMPLGGFEHLGPRSLAAVKAWILAGAPYDGQPVVDPDFVPADASAYVHCAATDEAGLRACFPAKAADPMVMRLTTPPLHLEPGTEHVLCSRLDVPVDRELLIAKASGFQMDGGHHAAVYVSVAPKHQPDPVACDDLDMSSLRFIIGAGGAGGADLTLPAGTALRIAPGQQIIVQSHYINTGTTPREVMDAVDLQLTTAVVSPIIADSLSLVDSDFTIPAGAVGFERKKTCHIDREVDVHLLLGHTHDLGVLFELELTRAGSTTPTLLYHATDGPSLRDTPDVTVYDPPLALGPGDALTMTCRWDNPTGHDVGWPEEMCVTFSYYSPGVGFLICDSEDDTPVLIDGGGAAGCGEPGDVGNDKGVGTYCTAEGGECADNGAADFCIAAFSEHNYCTIIFCASDEDCGSGAHCVEDGAGSACVPDYCE